MGSEFLVNSASPYDQERASVATLSNGDFIVTWNDFRTGDWEVRGQVFHPSASGATKIGAEFIVDTAFYNSRMVAPVTGLTNGNFVVGFEDTSGEVRAQVFTATGTKLGSEFVVNTQTSGNQGFSSITALTNGGFAVTWSDEGSPSDGSGSSIKAQVYDAGGSKIGGEYVVNSQTNSYQYYPTVSALANGGFVIGWQDFSQALGDTSSYGITAQIFNLSNAPAAPTIVSITDDVSPNTGVLANGASTNDTNLTVRIATGSNFAGDVVQLFDGQTALGNAVTLTLADIARGYINLQTGQLADATHAITAKITDTAGLQSSAATPFNVTVDTVAPAVAVTGVALDNGNLPTVTVNGTAEAGLLVSVYDGATLVGTATAGVSGAWSLAGLTLTNGANNLSAKATDAAGNTGTSANLAAPTLVSTGTTSVDASAVTAMGYVVLGNGTLDVLAAGNVAGQITIGNSGVVNVGAGATTQHATILNGGAQFDYGTANDTTVQSGGAQHVYQGGHASGTTVAAGGYQDVWNSTVNNTSLSGNQQVLTGGTAADTAVETGGYQYVGSGGTADRTVVKTGGFQYVDAGGTAHDTVVAGGFQYVGGSASGTSVGGGNSLGGGVSTGVRVESGGAQHVYFGGSAIGTTVAAGGFQDVYNATVTDTNLSGHQQVLAGGVANHTVIANGGQAYIGSGGRTTDTVINAGGLQYVDGGATATQSVVDGGFLYVAGNTSGTTINNGGTEQIGAGGVTGGTTVEAGGLQYVGGTATNSTVHGGQIFVGAGGVANDAHLVGGIEHVSSGGTAHGVDFAGTAATLLLDDAAGLTGTVSNFEIGDTIDLLNTSVSSFTFDGTTLALATNSGTRAYQFAGVQSGTELNVVDDGHGGTAISLSLLVQQSASMVPGSGLESGLVPQDTTQEQTTLTTAHA